jgi:hypothetical protein
VSRADVSLVIPGRDGAEVRISLHPISLALVVSEVIEDVARKRCRRRGHREDPNDAGHCSRCGNSLPDDGSPYRTWLPDAYRAIRGASS